ncbi:MAG: helix-turn-helix domain-containing protein [bacterium]|nr:helix-turn-helix domain-containing protein [bacterium]
MHKQLNAFFRSARSVMGAVLLVLLFCIQAFGLDPDKLVDNYMVDQWAISDGIPSNNILSIAQTPDGYLWVATSKGLVRFDGKTFSPVRFVEKDEPDSLENAVPDILFVDKEGILWIGSAAGLTSYRYQTGEFKTYTTADGITKDRIRNIKEDMRGNLWVSFSASYLDRFSNGEFTAFNASHGLEGKKINSIIEDRKGNLLFGTRENGAFVYRDGKFFRYPIDGLGNSQIIIMCEDGKGVLWIGTNNGLLMITDKGTRRYTAPDGLSNNYITDITEDSDRNLWVGTVKGINRIKRQEDGSITFESLLKPFTIFCLFEDREKSLWAGTLDSGLKRLKDRKFIPYPPLKEREEILFSLFEDPNGDTWAGTLDGKLFLCRGKNFIRSVELPAISGTAVTAITGDMDGSHWLGTNGKGVFQKKKNNTVVSFTTREGLAYNLVMSIFRDSRGDLWFSTFDGVSRYRGGVMESFKTRDGLAGKKAHNVYEDKNGNIWIAADKGVTLLKGGELKKENVAKYLPDISVSCIYEDPSDSGGGEYIFWMATHGAGLKRLKDGVVTSYTTDCGFTTNFIYQFFEDQRENFWLMSDSGILRVAKKELNSFADGTAERINCVSFGISDGMQSIEFNNELSRHSALKTRSGEFRFVTKKGITVVNPLDIQINKVPPPVVMESVVFDDLPVSLYGENTDAQIVKGIIDFEFHFTAPTLLSPEKVNFKYRLEGFDTKWLFLPPGKERVARYRDLEPGTYTFRVTASNSEGVWNRTGVSMTFTLEPFFYETVLFKIFILLLLCALVGVGFFLYKKRPFEKPGEKYKGSSLEPQYADECIKKLKRLMKVEKIYRDADLSLQVLAEKSSISTHLLSRILNDKLNKNFSEFVNSYRVEEAKKILAGPDGADKKIITVAFDVGFNTKVAFYNAFKKYTGMTPSQYRDPAARGTS